jgi:phospholipid/cholesterol/gamma-HCH transport system permease protein
LQSLTTLADKFGGYVFRVLFYVRASLELSLESWMLLIRLKWLSRPAVLHVMVRQLYFTGVQSFGWVLVASALVGLLVVYSIVDFSRQVQDLTLIGSLFGGVFLQEIAPMLIAIFLLVRSGVAVVTEVGNIQARREPLVLASLGISENEYLYMPRLVAFAVSGLILTFIFVFLAAWFGGLSVSLTNILSFSEFIFELRQGVYFSDIIIMVCKSILYPVLMVLVLISQGHKVGDDPNQIPVRATYGMLGSLSAILVIDIVIAVIQKLL